MKTYPVVVFYDYYPACAEQQQWLREQITTNDKFQPYGVSPTKLAPDDSILFWVWLQRDIPRHHPELVRIAQAFIEKFGLSQSYLEVEQLKTPRYCVMGNERGRDSLFTQQSLTCDAAEFDDEDEPWNDPQDPRFAVQFGELHRLAGTEFDLTLMWHGGSEQWLMRAEARTAGPVCVDSVTRNKMLSGVLKSTLAYLISQGANRE